MKASESPLLLYLASHLLDVHFIRPEQVSGRTLQHLEGFHSGLHHYTSSHQHDGYALAKAAQKEWITSLLDLPVRGSA